MVYMLTFKTKARSVIFKNSASTWKRTQHFSITKMLVNLFRQRFLQKKKTYETRKYTLWGVGDEESWIIDC
jgi:hypothetical protein